MPRTLLDFMAPPSQLPEAFRPRKSPGLAQLLAPRKGEKILVLGYGDAAEIAAWQEEGVELLLYVQSEAEAVQARKSGLRAVLSQAEYLGDLQRFDGIILLDPGYRLFDPLRALRRLTRALRPGGRLLLELPLSGHREAGVKLLERVCMQPRWRGRVERVVYPEAASWRETMQKAGIDRQEDRVIYRHRQIPYRKLDGWIGDLLRPCALLLDAGERRELHETLRKAAEAQCENGSFLDEDVVLRIVAGPDQES
jgi:SAM-dependent methyltransferase